MCYKKSNPPKLQSFTSYHILFIGYIEHARRKTHFANAITTAGSNFDRLSCLFRMSLLIDSYDFCIFRGLNKNIIHRLKIHIWIFHLTCLVLFICSTYCRLLLDIIYKNVRHLEIGRNEKLIAWKEKLNFIGLFLYRFQYNIAIWNPIYPLSTLGLWINTRNNKCIEILKSWKLADVLIWRWVMIS